MTEAKWVMNRAGLLNFWYYDDEIFHFSDGKLAPKGNERIGKIRDDAKLSACIIRRKKIP